MRANNKRQEKMKSFASKCALSHQWSFTLLLPIRNIFLPTKQLIKRIELNESFSVLELGPGRAISEFLQLEN